MAILIPVNVDKQKYPTSNNLRYSGVGGKPSRMDRPTIGGMQSRTITGPLRVHFIAK
jgi:hypothetical protein